MSGRLEGKVALITGGGLGIGAAIARAFVKEGAKIVITGRRQEVLEEFAAALPAGSVEVCAGDISILEDSRAMAEKTVKVFGKLNVLVNNAGIDPPGTVTEIDIDRWMKVINTNIHGTFFMCRHAIPKMIEAGGGSIINISSLAGLRCIPAMPAYTTSKAGMIGMTNAIALDYGVKGIRANVICPGATATNMMRTSMQALAAAQNTDVDGALGLLTRFCPLPRVCEPDEISPAAVYLASDESSYMTGSQIVLDGGACVVDPCGASTSSLGTAWGGGV
ncbi:MAG: SDR family oxidoreductase [Clostridiales Family XIII bacterium]|jgi:NAD(P)-dependent dehydrogenase (short-subunit alcohol dehydrogenase family)|nr:SDR family oxidoreductase [Clostridiales Family XIII bacterium]